MMIVRLLPLVFVFLAGPCFSAIVPYDVWVNKMRSEAPASLCKKGSFYTTCWKLSEKRCLKLAKKEMKLCTSLVPRQKYLDLNKVGYKYSKRVGKCVSKKINQKLKKKVKFLAKASLMCRKK